MSLTNSHFSIIFGSIVHFIVIGVFFFFYSSKRLINETVDWWVGSISILKIMEI